MTNERRHCYGVDNIVKNLALFDIRNGIVVAKEPQLYDATGRLIGEPDVLVIDGNSEWHKFEYKCTNRHSDKAHYQLERDSELIKRIFGIECHDYFVHNNLKFKRL